MPEKEKVDPFSGPPRESRTPDLKFEVSKPADESSFSGPTRAPRTAVVVKPAVIVPPVEREALRPAEHARDSSAPTPPARPSKAK